MSLAMDITADDVSSILSNRRPTDNVADSIITRQAVIVPAKLYIDITECNRDFIRKSLAITNRTNVDLFLKVDSVQSTDIYACALDVLFTVCVPNVRSVTIKLGFHDTHGYLMDHVRTLQSLRKLHVILPSMPFFKGNQRLQLHNLTHFSVTARDVALIAEKQFFSSWRCNNITSLKLLNVIVTPDVFDFVEIHAPRLTELELSTCHSYFQDMLDKSPRLTTFTIHAMHPLPKTLTHPTLTNIRFRQFSDLNFNIDSVYTTFVGRFQAIANKTSFPCLTTITFLEFKRNRAATYPRHLSKYTNIIEMCAENDITLKDEDDQVIDIEYLLSVNN